MYNIFFVLIACETISGDAFCAQINSSGILMGEICHLYQNVHFIAAILNFA